FVSHCTPKPDDHLAVEIAGSTRQSVHLLGTPNLQPTDGVESSHTLFSQHHLPWFFPASSPAMPLVFGRAEARSRLARWALIPGPRHPGLRALRPAIRHDKPRARLCHARLRSRPQHHRLDVGHAAHIGTVLHR